MSSIVYYRTMTIHNALKNNDFKSFTELFDDYINNPQIYNEFTYDTDGPATCHHYSKYPYCECYKTVNYKDLRRIHRHNAKLKCNCVNGKFYLILRDAYFTLVRYRSSRALSEIINIEGLMRKENDIIMWLKNQHYPIMMDWDSIHIDAYYYPMCLKCDSNMAGDASIDDPNEDLMILMRI